MPYNANPNRELYSRELTNAAHASCRLPGKAHGETAWSLTGQHTGLTDIPLTEHGERNARQLEKRLKGLTFAKVFTSPLQRATRTCELAGFKSVAEVLPDLVEWNYGDYEGRRTDEIQNDHAGWNVFRDGCPGGESPAQIGERARPSNQQRSAPLKATYCYSPAATSCESSPPAGSPAYRPTAANISC